MKAFGDELYRRPGRPVQKQSPLVADTLSAAA